MYGVSEKDTRRVRLMEHFFFQIKNTGINDDSFWNRIFPMTLSGRPSSRRLVGLFVIFPLRAGSFTSILLSEHLFCCSYENILNRIKGKGVFFLNPVHTIGS